MNFKNFNFTAQLYEGLEAMRFTTPTPIQEQAIPIIMKGNDIIACAQTGTGKTAAFLLPVLNKMMLNKSTGVTTLVLLPTRELAIQIDRQIEGFSYFLPVTSIAVYGGNDAELWDKQKNALIMGADLIAATPGRLIQHIAMGYVNLSTIKYLILDEADRMLDMGFHDDIMHIIKDIPTDRQTLMFSATMPPKIRELAKNILKNPSEIDIAIAKPAEGIIQGAYLVYDYQKIPLINSLLKGKEDLKSIIIFSSTKLKVKEIYRSLKGQRYNVSAIHSDLEQSERDSVMLDFRNKKLSIIVATDIIARGIDVEGIDLIINFDVPRDAEDYVHRVGRTARAQSTGLALTFINEKEQYNFSLIEKLIEKEINKIPLPKGFQKGPKYNPKNFRV
ncbi:MAG: DEAD/DEAH box helicase [Marinilabiliaceae bacterium]|nr:DEAD/DEAH box helicase [Marinilabiliaceae bacterium]